MSDNNLEQSKQELLAEIDRRIEDKIIEQTNADLLKKLINNADTLTEAVAIAELGTTYRRTGLHFDKRLEKFTNTIKYFKKNEELSFKTDEKGLTHKLIIGDNYDALLNLLIEYRGKIDVIYIDPPYGKDSMGEFAETNYNNAITRDNLLSMLYPRLVLAKQLLSDSGVIYCSMDDKNQAYVKCLFDSIFGERNFIANIIWERAYAPVNLKKHFSESHDYVLCYANDIDSAKCNGLQRTADANNRYSNLDSDPRGEWKAADCTVGPAVKDKVYEIELPSGRKVKPASGRCWLYTKERFDEMVADNHIWFSPDGNSVPAVKKFLSEVKQGMTPMTIWKYSEVGHSQDATKDLKSIFGNEFLFPYPKPVGLMKRLIQLYGNKPSIILDFLAGSGTIGQAVLDLNREDNGRRSFIMCQLEEKTSDAENGIASDVTARRFKRIMAGEDYDGNKDFDWIKNNEPYGDNLDVYNISTVANFEKTENKTPFDVIDETLYGKEKMAPKDKIKWVCENFDNTQKSIEKDDDYMKRIEGAE